MPNSSTTWLFHNWPHIMSWSCLSFVRNIDWRIFSVYWRLNNFTVEVVASDNKTREICGVYSKAEPVGPGRSYSFDCRSKVGRFVYIRRLRSSVHEQVMTLCEVIIDGYPVSSAPLAEVEQRLPRPPNPANSVSTMLSPTGNTHAHMRTRIYI